MISRTLKIISRSIKVMRTRNAMLAGTSKFRIKLIDFLIGCGSKLLK